MNATLDLIKPDDLYYWHLRLAGRKPIYVECYAEGCRSRQSAIRAANRVAKKLGITITKVEGP